MAGGEAGTKTARSCSHATTMNRRRTCMAWSPGSPTMASGAAGGTGSGRHRESHLGGSYLAARLGGSRRRRQCHPGQAHPRSRSDRRAGGGGPSAGHGDHAHPGRGQDEAGGPGHDGAPGGPSAPADLGAPAAALGSRDGGQAAGAVCLRAGPGGPQS